MSLNIGMMDTTASSSRHSFGFLAARRMEGRRLRARKSKLMATALLRESSQKKNLEWRIE
jgi:hypothetical protein